MALHLYSTIHPNKTKRFTNINELRHSVFKGIHIQFEVWCNRTLKNSRDIFTASFLSRHSPMKLSCFKSIHKFHDTCYTFKL